MMHKLVKLILFIFKKPCKEQRIRMMKNNNKNKKKNTLSLYLHNTYFVSTFVIKFLRGHQFKRFLFGGVKNREKLKIGITNHKNHKISLPDKAGLFGNGIQRPITR